MNTGIKLSRPRTGLSAARFVAGFVVLLALLAAGCKHAPAPEKQSSTKDERTHPAEAQPSPVMPATPAPPAFTRPHFAVQVGAYRRRGGAESLAFQLSAEYGLQTLVAPVEMRGTTYYRVRIMVETREQAERLAETFLRTRKLKAWVVSWR